ncbi:MAG: response regulator [Gammaproteobacteria bacterium]|nr:response regulator [Gammaproteobacteria bacterium]MDH5777339.1 response regulator [Gammaproteobacteria bacterium]
MRDSKVLIVDDDPRNIRILEEILDGEFEVEKANNGAEALEKMVAFKPDIALLDIMMPDISGMDVLKAIRNNEDLKNTRTIFVSGKSHVDDRLIAYEAGIDDYIVKPFDDDELLSKVRVYSKLKADEEVESTKMDFMRLMSHEINTPLHAIIGLSELLVTDAQTDPETKDMLQTIHASGKELKERVDDIQTYVRLKNIKYLEYSQTVSSDLVKLALLRGDNHSSDIDPLFNRTVMESVGIQCDLRLVVQAMENIMGFVKVNANQDEQIDVTEKIVGNDLNIMISNFGDFLDIECLEKLLAGDSIYKFTNSESTYDLKLLISRKIIDLHRGSIEVGQHGMGCFISVMLPVCESLEVQYAQKSIH